MLSKLPLEIQVQLIKNAPESSLKYVNSHFYILYNDLFYEKLIRTFGEDIIQVLEKVLPWMKIYIKTLDTFRYHARNAIASRLKLKDEYTSIDFEGKNNEFHCMYIKDSWKYIYSILANKRLFAEYKDYRIDEPTNYVFNHFVEINRTYLLSYEKDLWLVPGKYNLNIGLLIKDGKGLGTTKFEIKYHDKANHPVVQTFFPPTNINDILPKMQFCLLKIGEFNIPQKEDDIDNLSNKLVHIQFVMEEIGLYLKSGFRIFFIDIAQPSMLFNDYDLLYYTLRESNYKHFINIPLKNLYKALNYVQNGKVTSQQPSHLLYGSGDPLEIWEEYDHEFLQHYDFPVIPEDGNNNNIKHFDLIKYADFYFNNSFKRLFKFNTIYQRRQFINRFGDFELEWIEEDNKKQDKPEQNADRKLCFYDLYGLKWKMPIVSEL
ncbi:Piso0_005449 [Millerozyma farinosa CBS 7064]|uniref:Piso0_005449 protein n=1 Tax=Pichia sorbitophila (strain ATCC MYA-4447 / BCRC 22081 / CBS 7064 / NBRC 10061 / NRRL Y-12695) TaxID=559304 RepID=G8Y546_PICSO|nr:Piso0_005449 [Millerozyma farinosa CBS 7064]